MSIQTQITRIRNNIASAYVVVDTKGGTIPEVKNSDNLYTAINTIPTYPKWEGDLYEE